MRVDDVPAFANQHERKPRRDVRVRHLPTPPKTTDRHPVAKVRTTTGLIRADDEDIVTQPHETAANCLSNVFNTPGKGRISRRSVEQSHGQTVPSVLPSDGLFSRHPLAQGPFGGASPTSEFDGFYIAIGGSSSRVLCPAAELSPVSIAPIYIVARPNGGARDPDAHIAEFAQYLGLAGASRTVTCNRTVPCTC